VDEHLLSNHTYSDKYGGSTTLLRCASAVIGDHKSSMLDEQYVIPLEDLCPYHQHVHHLVASQPASIPHIEQTADEGDTIDDDYRISSELEFPDYSLGAGERLSVYDSLPTYGFTARTTTATITRNSRTPGNSRRSFVTFKPQTSANIVPADSPGGARTAPPGSCASLDLIKPSRTPSTSPAAESVVISQQDGSRSPIDVAVGCVSLTQSSAEACNAV